MVTNRRTRRIAKAMKRVAMPLASAQLRGLIKAALKRFDGAFAARLAADGERHAVACQPGSAGCCERAVLLTWAEADLLVAQHRGLVAELLPELDRQNDLLRELGASRGAGPLHEGPAESEHAELLDRWSAQRVPCAFMASASRECRIHESRPLACRAWAVSSPPEACALPSDDPLAPPHIIHDDQGPEYRAAQLTLMSATSDALGGTVLMGLLPSLVPRVYRNAESGGHTVPV